MQLLLLFYYVNISIATILAVMSSYLIICKSTAHMGKFKWLLLNTTISTYLESNFWAVLFAPIVPTSPLPHVYSKGILGTVFKVPVNIQWGLLVFILGFMATSIMMSFSHRYLLLLPLSPWGSNLNPLLVKGVQIFCDYFAIVVGGVICGILSVYCFNTAEETKQMILKLDPSVEVPEGAQTFRLTLATQIWGFLNLLHVLLAAPSVTFIVIHSNQILKASATSKMAIAMHKEAIRSLVIQIFLLVAVTSIPVAVFGFCLMWKVDRLPAIIDLLSDFSLAIYTTQSFFVSIAILTTIKVYRVFLIRKMFFWRSIKTPVTIKQCIELIEDEPPREPQTPG